jgi:hypothetical protein
MTAVTCCITPCKGYRSAESLRWATRVVLLLPERVVCEGRELINVVAAP